MGMNKSDKQQKKPNDARQARLEQALRENLHRRKAQSRGRKAEARASLMDTAPADPSTELENKGDK